MVRRIYIFLFILVTVLLGTWALLRPGFFRVHDFVHAARVSEMHEALFSGHIPPRWSSNFGYGYGMPLFNFYAPLPYILGAVLLEYFSILIVLKILIILATAGTAVGMYKLAREHVGLGAGLLAVLAATLAPYRAVNIFVRGAFSEVWGMAWIPWLFLGVSRVTKARGGLIILILSTAGMALSHNLVTLMAVSTGLLWGFTLLFSEYWWNKVSIRAVCFRAARLIVGIVSGLCLAAWYIVPSLLEKKHTQLDATILTGYFDFRLHFLYIRQLFSNTWGYGGSQWGPDDGISFFLGFGQIFAVCIAVALLVAVFFSNIHTVKKVFTRKYFSLITILGLVCLTLGLSLSHALPVWEFFPFFKYLQFPWRWLSVSTVLLALLLGQSIELIRSKPAKYFLGAVLTLLLCLPIGWFRPESWLDNPDALYYTDAVRIRNHMSEILPDYIPSSVVVSELDEWESFENNTSGVRVVEHVLDHTHEHLLRVEQSSTQSAVFPIAYFPGWRAEIDGVQVHVEPSPVGLVSFAIPEGSHMVGLYFAESPVRNVANMISVVAAICILYYWFKSRATRSSK